MQYKMAVFIIVSVFLLSSNNSKPEFSFVNFVECYYDESSQEPIIIYDSENGKPIDTLEKLSSKMCWYKIAISESKNDFLKLENISVFPSCMSNRVNSADGGFKGLWIKNKNLCINISDMDVDPNDGIFFYEQPNLNSSIIFKSGKFLKTTLIDINGTWAKVSFVNENKTIIGWLQKEDQCPYAWTSCPKTTK